MRSKYSSALCMTFFSPRGFHGKAVFAARIPCSPKRFFYCVIRNTAYGVNPGGFSVCIVCVAAGHQKRTLRVPQSLIPFDAVGFLTSIKELAKAIPRTQKTLSGAS